MGLKSREGENKCVLDLTAESESAAKIISSKRAKRHEHCTVGLERRVQIK